jgi:hypothetical protein
VLGSLGFILEDWYRWIALSLAALLLWIAATTIFWRVARPWRKHHYPLMMVWSAALGGTLALHGRQDFDECAQLFLKMSFPNIDDESVRKLLNRSRASLWEVMVELGIINKAVPLSEPSMIESRDGITQRQAENPDFVRHVLLFATIIGAHESPQIAAHYILARLVGQAE